LVDTLHWGQRLLLVESGNSDASHIGETRAITPSESARCGIEKGFSAEETALALTWQHD